MAASLVLLRCVFSSGLRFLPSLLPIKTQSALLSRLWFRDLTNPLHKTNLHLHYYIPYPEPDSPQESSVQPDSKEESRKPCNPSVPPYTFFHIPSPSQFFFQPKDPLIHKALPLTSVLTKKLRWMTLGGQYDWTRKVYPEMDEKRAPPSVLFPADISALICALFPNITPQAAIANLYTPGDVLFLHRDISEASSAPLVSLSIGSDALFIIGNENEKGHTDLTSSSASKIEGADSLPFAALPVLIHSGDVLLMSGASRWAWHGVSKIIGGTTPQELEDWPGEVDSGRAGGGIEKDVWEGWKGWMKDRRVNLNVRQMWD